MRAWFEAITDAFGSDGFVPRRICGLWPDWLVWEHVLGNALIWLAYVAMPIMIWRLDCRRSGWRPFAGVIRAFACFIALCGLGHFLDMVAFFHPLYRLSGHILALTGLVSWWTAWSFRRAWPAFMALKSPEELERIIAERTEELERAEAGLRESEARLRAIVDTAVDGIITIDEGEIIESLNPAALRAFGYSAGELLGRNVSVLMPSPYREEHDGYLSYFRRAGERKIMGIGREVVGRRKDGSTFPIDLSMSEVSLGQRRIFTGIIRDITERKQAEEALRAKERVYRAIGETIAYGVWICDVEGRNTYVSESLLRMLGLTQQQFSEFGWKEVIHPEEAERTFAAWKECVRLEGNWDVEMRFRGTDGRWHPILGRGVPVRDDDGRIICWAGINLDIGRIKETEDALRRSEERQRQALVAARIGHWEWDIREDRLALLGGVKTLYGRPDESPPATFKEFLEFIHPDDQPGLIAAAERSILEGRPFESEFRVAWADGTVRWMAGKGGLFRDESGAAIRIAGVNIDITEKKEAEARILLLNEGLERRVAGRTTELAAARDAAEAATRAKGNFLANMSHEIRTPMGGVIGMTDLLLDTQLDDLQLKYAGTIRSSAEALLTVINDILDFSKIEAGKLTLERTDCDIRTLMQEVADLLVPSANQKGLKIYRRIDLRVPARLVGDPVRIRQVLTNLAGNAVKFTDRGEVTLEAIRLSRGRGKATIRFLVSDTGIGIPQDRQLDIFDSFTQVEGDSSRRYGGTGLGLSICRSLVDLMGGRIGMESTPGRGSTFWFTLDLEEGAEVVRAPGTSRARPEAPGAEHARLPIPLRILLAEDNDVNRIVAIGMAERLGCAVDAVRNGREAVEKLDHGRHDLILMDVQMPEMDGIAATGVIRDREKSGGRRIPIIALTAHAMQGDRERCVSAGMDGYLTKPLRPGPLRQVLLDWIGGANGSTQAPGSSRPEGTRSFSPDELESSCDGNPVLIGEVLDTMVASTPARLRRLKEAVDARERREAASEAHNLKGAFLTVGAGTLAADCQALIEHLGRDDFPSAESASGRILEGWSRLRDDIRLYLADRRTSRSATAK